jgi:hypothetical protein
MNKKLAWGFFGLYLALFGSYCGLELDTYVTDLPFFQASTLVLFLNILCVVLAPVAVYLLFASIPRLWRRRAVRVAVRTLGAVYFHFILFLAVYKSVRKVDFDFYFMWYNLADTLPALWKLFAPWFPVVLLLIALFALFQKHAYAPLVRRLEHAPRSLALGLGGVIALSALSQAMTIDSVRGSASGFVYSSFLSDRSLRDEYAALYGRHIERLRSETPRPGARFSPGALGDAVFVVKQESLSGLLTGSRVTPELMRAARDGVLFPRMYGNAVQSLRGYECVLCGVPPGAAGALVDEYAPEEIGKLTCLPEVFRSLGYRTLYFFGGSHNPRIVRFARSTGFEEVLSDEIMRPGDTRFDWGYREDIFYRRVFEHLDTHYAGEKVFVFLDTGATNHTPFEVLDEALLDRIPYPEPETFEERLSNTTFVQDAYFGLCYDLFRGRFGARGSLVAVSDHSWPIPAHENNIYNERGAWEENFLISLLFVPPGGDGRFAAGAEVPERFSQMDLLPTMLDLLGMEHAGLLGESFAPWLLVDGARAKPAKAKLSIQPYGGGYISLVRYPEKVLFDVLGRDVAVYDLDRDPGERSPAGGDLEEYLPRIRSFFALP